MARLIENKSINARKGEKVYCHEPYAAELYSLITDSISETVVIDVERGHSLPITGIDSIKGDTLVLATNTYHYVYVELNKEKRFYQIVGTNQADFIELIQTGKGWEQLLSIVPEIKVISSDGYLQGSFFHSYADTIRAEMFTQIKKPSTVYQAKIHGKNNGGFFVDIMGVDAYLPGGQASANKILDFDSYIGKTVPVMVENHDGNSFIVSNKKYIQHILPSELEKLSFCTKHTGKVTGSIRIGIFCEFNDIFTGMLHVSEMTKDVTRRFNSSGYREGDEIEFYVKEIICEEKRGRKKRKIILSAIDPNPGLDQMEQHKEAGTVFSAEVVYKNQMGYIVKSSDGTTGKLTNYDSKKIKLQESSKIKVVIADVYREKREILFSLHE